MPHTRLGCSSHISVYGNVSKAQPRNKNHLWFFKHKDFKYKWIGFTGDGRSEETQRMTIVKSCYQTLGLERQWKEMLPEPRCQGSLVRTRTSEDAPLGLWWELFHQAWSYRQDHSCQRCYKKRQSDLEQNTLASLILSLSNLPPVPHIEQTFLEARVKESQGNVLS